VGRPGQADSVGAEKPPVDDPIKSGEPVPDDKPDKQGRTGKAKGGRPKGSKAERERQEREATEAENDRRAKQMAPDIAGVCQLAFGFVATRAGEHWMLQDEEAKRLGYRIARVDIKWSGLLDRYGEEIMLIGCVAGICWPRIEKDIRDARERAREKPAKVDGVETKPGTGPEAKSTSLEPEPDLDAALTPKG